MRFERTLPFAGLPFEWTPRMLKAALLKLLEFNRGLLVDGYCTADAHLWRVGFDGTTPVVDDSAAIVRLPEHRVWPGLEELTNVGLNALLVFQHGHTELARALLLNNFGVTAMERRADSPPGNGSLNEAAQSWRSTCRTLLNSTLTRAELARENARRRRWRAERDLHLRNKAGLRWTASELDRLESKVRLVRLPKKRSTWSEYRQTGLDPGARYAGTADSLKAASQATVKTRSVRAILERLRPGTVLDIACNRGLFCQMAAQLDARACGIDTDEASLDRLFEDSKRLDTRVVPFYVNAIAPAVPACLLDSPFPTVTRRLRAECVFAFAILHHLCLGPARLSLARALTILTRYSSRYLVVEFVPPDDEFLRAAYPNHVNAYDRETLLSATDGKLKLRKTFPSYPHKRTLYVFEKDAAG